MRLLVIGDPHVTVEELADCERLVQCILDAAKDYHPDAFLFLGDLFHTHALVRVEVMEFWDAAFERIRKAFYAAPIYVLVGNHDRSHDQSVKGCAIQSKHAHVIRESTKLNDDIWLAPWYATNEAFLASLQPGKVLFCHQTIDGSKFENGFWAPDGVNPALIPFDTVISGHIHAPQEFGKVWYPGAPRWRIASDANTDRAIYGLTIEEGKIVNKAAYNTAEYCRMLVHIKDVEGIPCEEPYWLQKAREAPFRTVKIDIHGSLDYIIERTGFWDQKSPGARIATFPVSTKTPIVRESEGIPVALQKFIEGWQPKHGTPLETLKRLAVERIHV